MENSSSADSTTDISGHAAISLKSAKTIIATTLIHAGADLMIMVPIFISYGVTTLFMNDNVI